MPRRRASNTHAVVDFGMIRPQRTRWDGQHGTGLPPETRIGQAVVVTDEGCWAYKGELDRYHAIATNGGGRQEPVHRFVYRICKGPIPPRMHVHHTCRNKGCCNPDHLVAMPPEWHMGLHANERKRQGTTCPPEPPLPASPAAPSGCAPTAAPPRAATPRRISDTEPASLPSGGRSTATGAPATRPQPTQPPT